MRRPPILLFALCAAAALYDHQSAQQDAGEAHARSHVILIVSDGLRWQEVFRGADSTILFASAAVRNPGLARARRQYWKPTIEERRAALMPFLWGTIAREGRMRGNRDAGSRVDVANAMKFSYPGYNEMLTGRPDPRVDRNDYGPNPNVTVFEWLNRRDGFRDRVAAFGTWDTFQDIFNAPRSGIDVHTNGAKPHDALVQQAVLPYLKEHAPRAIFVGFAETDDWAHEGRYDRFLDAVHAVDRYLGELWSAIEADPTYRGRTTVIFTADHGRGRTAADWMHHGRDIPGSGETFIVTLGAGADVLAGQRNGAFFLGEVASATAGAVGLRYGVGERGAPVPQNR